MKPIPSALLWVGSSHKGGVAYVSQSILQRWLREVHSMSVHVLPIIKTDDEKMYYSWGIIGLNRIGYNCDPHRKGDSYEDQLEVGLLTALKQI